MFYQQPPVGNSIRLSNAQYSARKLDSFFFPFQPRFYASGTTALAATFLAAIRSKNITRPEVILPAYGCPDLISAAVFVGVRPVLVDLEQSRPWIDLEQLAECISEQTIGIVAVDLFGIPERFEALRRIANSVDAVLIEDSAQSFPVAGDSHDWHGDLVVISFGRGKPVSLLGGGAVLHRGGRLAELLPLGSEQPELSWSATVVMKGKMHLYNKMISPYLYWLPESLPFLHLGETRYHPLQEIKAMEPERLALLPANITAYQADELLIQKKLASMLEEFDFPENLLQNLPKICETLGNRKLLRYPLLVDPAIRDKLYRELKRNGLGPSKMYPGTLPTIPGVEKFVAGQDDFPQAEAFASRILTLATHNGIGHKDLLKLRRVLARLLN